VSQQNLTTAQSRTLAQYSVPVYRDPYRRDQAQVDLGLIATLTISTVLTLTVWCWAFWRLSSKAGYTGAVRWIWFLTMAFPFTTVWSLALFGLIPWPIQKQTNRNSVPTDDIDEELNRLKKLNQRKD